MNQEIKNYIQKQKSLQKEICEKIYQMIFKFFPKIEEGMKWGVPAFGDGIFYFVALKDSVNFGFSVKDFSQEELKIFDSKGKTMRAIKINSLEDLDQQKIIDLLKLTGEKNNLF